MRRGKKKILWLQELQGKAKGAIMGMGVKHYRKDGKEHKGEYHKNAQWPTSFWKDTQLKSSVRLYHYGDLSKNHKTTLESLGKYNA